MVSLKIERQLLREEKFLIAGVDEAGRGALAGPVVAGAILFNVQRLKMIKSSLNEVKDSKCLSPKKRESLYKKIQDIGVISTATVSAAMIDKINIYNASLLVMKKAVLGLPLKPDVLLIDGSKDLEVNIDQLPIIDGDNICFTISCASIIAKVYRDNIMRKMDKIYPQYGFIRHKGYGTRLHCQLIKKYGPSPIHRLTFEPIKNVSISKNGKRICHSF